MSVDRDTLDKIAHLARLQFDEKDADKMLQDMSNILAWVDQLKEVDTEGVEPLTSMSHEVNVFRSDEVKEELSNQEALGQAPESNEYFFMVPKILE